METSVEHMH
jgi:hypothetical protein